MMNNKTSVEKPPWLIASDAAQLGAVARVAWIRVGALGDLLVAMACLKETSNFFPKAKITVFGPRLWLELIDPRLWPCVDTIVVTVDGHKGLRYLVKNSKWVAEDEAPRKLSFFMKGCQVSINLRVESLRYAWPALFSGIKWRFGTCQPHMRWLYSMWSPWLGKDPIVHERDRMLEILEVPRNTSGKNNFTKHNRASLKWKQTGVFNHKPDKYLVSHPGQHSQSLAKKWQKLGLPSIVLSNPVVVRKYGLVPGQYWLINPTASRWEKAWPKEKFNKLCKDLLPLANANKKELIVLGSPAETDWLMSVAETPVTGIRTVQPENLSDLIQVVSLADALVANTSSVQYISAATKTRCFTLMGRTFPARWGPLGPRDSLLCGKQQDPPPKDIFLDDYTAYDSLTEQQVYKSISEWLLSRG